YAAEVRALVRLLDHRQHQRALGQALDERVLADLAEAFGQRQQLMRAEVLIAEEDHHVLEERLAQRLDRLLVEPPGQIHTEDLGAERTGERSHVEPGFGRERHDDLPDASLAARVSRPGAIVTLRARPRERRMARRAARPCPRAAGLDVPGPIINWMPIRDRTELELP